MGRKIENREWKLQHIKNTRKTRTKYTALLPVMPFVFGLIAFVFDFYPFLIIGGVVTVAYVFLAYRAVNNLQNLAQMTMVYKLADESFQDEWNDYVTSVDYSMNREYEKYSEKRKVKK